MLVKGRERFLQRQPGVDGKLSVSRLETNSLALRAMSGAIEIPQLAKTHGDAREATKDPLDCPGAVRARLSRRRMQPERVLRLFDQDGQILFVVDLKSPLLQNHLCSALDELLRCTDGEGRIRLSDALQTAELLTDGCRVP
jgi:hypothetical protein